MSIEAASEAAEKEEAHQKSASAAPVVLKPLHLAAAALIFVGSLTVTALIASQAINEKGREEASALAKNHALDLKALADQLSAKDKEIDRLSGRLKESYEKQTRLLTRTTELEAKVKAFQGTLNVSKGPILPQQESTLPVNVSPILTTGETPFIRDGSRWLAVRKEGIFTASAASQNLRDAFAGKGMKAPEGARSLAAKPRPAAGSVLMMHPDREFTDLPRPILKWKRQAGMIGSVQCAILDQEGRTLALSEATGSDSWQPANPLPRGHSYTWRILSPNPADPEKAQVLAETTFQVLSEAESALLNRKLNEAGGSLLLRMAAYIESGLFASAEWEAQKFSDANPGLKDGQRLVGQMRALKPKRASEG